MKKMIFTAALLFSSMSIGAQAQSVESQALTTISTQHEEPTVELSEAPVSTESDYLMSFAEAIMVAALPPTTPGRWSSALPPPTVWGVWSYSAPSVRS